MQLPLQPSFLWHYTMCLYISTPCVCIKILIILYSVSTVFAVSTISVYMPPAKQVDFWAVNSMGDLQDRIQFVMHKRGVLT